MSDPFFCFFFGLLFQLKRIHLVTSYLANLAGIPSTKPFETFFRSQLWDGQSGGFHWANAFSSGGMDLSPFSRQACGGKLSLGESMVFRSANKRLFLWLLKDRKTSMLVRVGVSPRCVLFFSLLLMCLDIYISYTVSVIYILYKITYLLCLCMNYLSNC